MECWRFPDLKMKSFFTQSVMMEKYLFLFIFFPNEESEGIEVSCIHFRVC